MCEKICIYAIFVVPLQRELNEGTPKGSLDFIKIWINNNCKTGLRSI